jgi:Integrase zinc binding domain
MLSRYPTTTVDTTIYAEITTLEDNLFPATTACLKVSQNTIPDLQTKLCSNPNIYSTINCGGIDIICRKGKIIVDSKLFYDILAWYHTNLNHPGQDRTYCTIHAVFYTPNMEATVQKYVDNCQICKKTKISSKLYGHLPQTDLLCDPWEIIQIDLFGPWTFQDITQTTHHIQGLSIIDVATCWVELCPYSSKKSEDIALLVDQIWFCCYPRPRIPIIDNGSEFSFEFLEILRSYGVTPKPTTIKNPQTNAFVERVHQVIGDAIRSMELHTKHCNDVTIQAVLQNVAYGLHATYHSSIATSPRQLVFGRNMIINSLYLANWKNLATC